MHNFEKAEERLMRSLMQTRYEDVRNPPQPWRNVPFPPPARDLGFYIPTGNRMLDTILAGARPPIKYGGNGSGVAHYRGDGVHTPFGSSWIEQPAPEQFVSEAARRYTLAHELVHWTKEEGRATREAPGVRAGDMEAGRFPPGYAEEELVAEFGAAMLLDACGADPDWDQHAHYAGNWLASLPDAMTRRAAMARAMSKAEEAVEYLLQFAEGA